jgi:hypothetical protein
MRAGEQRTLSPRLAKERAGYVYIGWRKLADARSGIELRGDSLKLGEQRAQPLLLERRDRRGMPQLLDALAPVRHRPCGASMPVARTDHPRQMIYFLLDESRCDVSEIPSLRHARAPDSGSAK